uniref:OTU domain-containing protein n=1 Tax=Corethron hystrix TaxID=216773 RepID=A0A7S1BDC2_9STRA|mmetsp:Transcript_21095/g.47840  ORF Transcript_21095/g.47840 Transcript_21095/m.47840 type:complete len:223 (+) Transcript_21095:27-695(+)
MSEPNALPALAAGAVNDGEDETSSDMASRHKKELRGLEMQHRSSLKKISKTAGKGKKGKELLVRAENEYGRTRAELEARHFAERSLKLALKAEADVLSVVDREVSFSTTEKNLDNFKASSDAIPLSTTRSGEDVIARRRSKNKKKKQDRRIAEKKRDESIAAEIASAGPSFREIETEAIVRLNDFNGRSLTIREVGSDGHCLFRAVGLTTGHGEGAYGRIRE